MRIYLFLLLVISVTSTNTGNDQHSNTVVKNRTKRGAFWDFFQKLAITTNLALDQYNDTKTTFGEISDLISDSFTDPKPTKRPRKKVTTTPSPMDDGDNSTTTTTTERYRISRYELGKILGRNFRGLQRLYDIEVKDALNQSQYNIAGYQREAQMQFANGIIAVKKGAKVVPTSSVNNTTMQNSTRT